MKPDQDYLKTLLETCEAAPAPSFNMDELQAAGLNYDTDEFVFHMSILNDLRSRKRRSGAGVWVRARSRTDTRRGRHCRYD